MAARAPDRAQVATQEVGDHDQEKRDHHLHRPRDDVQRGVVFRRLVVAERQVPFEKVDAQVQQHHREKGERGQHDQYEPEAVGDGLAEAREQRLWPDQRDENGDEFEGDGGREEASPGQNPQVVGEVPGLGLLLRQEYLQRFREQIGGAE